MIGEAVGTDDAGRNEDVVSFDAIQTGSLGMWQNYWRQFSKGNEHTAVVLHSSNSQCLYLLPANQRHVLVASTFEFDGVVGRTVGASANPS